MDDNDRPSTGDHAVTTGDDRRATVSVAEAAAALGLSADAVRGRLQRGSLPGEKVNGTWQVHLAVADVVEEATGHQQAATGYRQATTGGATGDDGPRQAALIAHLHHLEGEVEYLRTELAKRSQELATERERADVLQREALGRIEAIEASASAPGTTKVETYRARTETSTASFLDRLRRWLRGAE